MKQLSTVDCSYGAPMGRPSFGGPPTRPYSIRLFKVRVSGDGAYDEGGAYWGLSPNGSCVWCATGDGYQAFTWARTRTEAAKALGIGKEALKIRRGIIE